MNAACAAQIRDSPVWQVGTTPACEPRHSDRNMPLPAQTVWGERTADYVQRVLERAWGDYRPSVDLYVRTGCMGYRTLTKTTLT